MVLLRARQTIVLILLKYAKLGVSFTLIIVWHISNESQSLKSAEFDGKVILVVGSLNSRLTLGREFIDWHVNIIKEDVSNEILLEGDIFWLFDETTK